MKKAIGIDLGGTSIQGGLIGQDGKIYKKLSRETPGGGGDEVLAAIAKLAKELMEPGVVGLGLGSPGSVDSDQGIIGRVANIPGWADTEVRNQLAQVFPNLPIFVENDANLAGLCEEWLGTGRGLDSFVMVTLGTGLGGAIYNKDSGILKGHNYYGGELGHAILYPQGRPCNCGQRGCSEKYLSGRALEESYFEESGKRLVAREIFIRSLEDPLAKKVVNQFAQDLAVFLTTLKNIFDPQALIIGGGVIYSRDYWWEQLIDAYNKEISQPGSLEILPAGFLNDAGMMGAARLVFMEEEKERKNKNGNT